MILRQLETGRVEVRGQTIGDEAIALIEQLSEKEQKNKRIVELWVQSLAQAGQWQQLKDKLSGWKKQLSTDDYQYWMKQTAQGFLFLI